MIARAWPDISFGLGQRIVQYHYLGDMQPTVDNCLAVRDGVFADPERDLREMAMKLASGLALASRTPGGDLAPVDHDANLAALVIYNAGHYPGPTAPWWQTYAGHVAAYRAALDRAAGML